MPSLSGCTIVRNSEKLGYPLEASIRTYLELCDEVVVAFDPTSEDRTEALVHDLARRIGKVRPLASPWNLDNHLDGTEITIQSNVAITACSSDWVLYVQADEAIHEDDHAAIRTALCDDSLAGAIFERRSFLSTLDSEIPEYFARGLLRLFRNGEGFAIGDAMTCGLVQGARGRVLDKGWRMFNYSRMGDRGEILRRCRSRDNFHHDNPEAIQANQSREFHQGVIAFDPGGHPLAIREHYRKFTRRTGSATRSEFPVTLVLLLGPGEGENIAPCLSPFARWPGEVLVFDDSADQGASDRLKAALGLASIPPERVRLIERALGGDFATARNLAHEQARTDWILHIDLDERWDSRLLQGLADLIGGLERDKKTCCGFPRANFLDGVLVNDLPSSEWSAESLGRALPDLPWPPKNQDFQFRLLKRSMRWHGSLHERPVALSEAPSSVAVVSQPWIIHSKSLATQRRQDRFYRSLGQVGGMHQDPDREPLASGTALPTLNVAPAPPATAEECLVVGGNLRELVLAEAFSKMCPGQVVVVETGTLRDPRPEASQGDGWSTLHLARLVSERGVEESRLYTIDNDDRCIRNAQSTIPESLHKWITWVCADSRKAIADLEEERIHLLYLDSSDDPHVILEEFRSALPKLAEGAFVVVDDTGANSAGPQGKGSLLLPEARRLGWRAAHRKKGESRMTILSRPSAGGAQLKAEEENRWMQVRPKAQSLPDLSDVEGFMSEGELEVLFRLAQEAREGVLEIGVHCGRSTIALALGRKVVRGSPVYAVDNGALASQLENLASVASAWPMALRNFGRFSVREYVQPIAMDSLHASVLLDRLQWDLVFIDGAHDSPSVLLDAALWIPRIRAGGHVAFHDYGPCGARNVVPTVDAVAGVLGLKKVLHTETIVVFSVGRAEWI